VILVVNCLIENTLVEDFNRALSWELAALGEKCHFIRARQLRHLEESWDDGSYSHLILSGSEASTTSSQPWEPALELVVRRFIETGRPVLGICYGHQFLAKTLAGPDHVRKSATPEFGWLSPRLNPSLLFKGMDRPWFMVCHYDEVCDLPSDFQILATSPGCKIQAFQYGELPVFGVQFHPEFGLVEAQSAFNAVSKCDSQVVITQPPADLSVLDQRKRIFANFLQFASDQIPERCQT